MKTGYPSICQKGGLSAAAGLCAESVFDTAVTSGMGYVFTTPMSIAAGVTNPYLTPNQKTGVVIMKTLEAVVGIAVPVAISQFWNPVGWTAIGVSVGCFVGAIVISYAVDTWIQSWEDENREGWLVK